MGNICQLGYKYNQKSVIDVVYQPDKSFQSLVNPKLLVYLKKFKLYLELFSSKMFIVFYLYIFLAIFLINIFLPPSISYFLFCFYVWKQNE